MNDLDYCDVCNILTSNDLKLVSRAGENFRVCKACRFKYGLSALPMPAGAPLPA